MGAELELQTCKKCGVTKLLTAFHKNASCLRGVVGGCKQCAHEARKAHPNYVKNWKAANARKDKKAQKAYSKNYREAHKEHLDLKAKEWWKNNKERKRAAASIWKRKNLERLRVYNNRRRAFLVAAGGNFTRDEALALLEAQGCACANPFCGADLNLAPRHLDHIKALANGGTNGIENLQWLCQPCNLSKGAKDFEAWLLQRAENT